MKKVNKDLSRKNSGPSKTDTEAKYNSANPVIINLVYDDMRQADGKMVATKFTVKRGLVEGREVIQVTFLGSENLCSFTILYPLEMAKHLASAFMVVTEGKAASSNETNLNW